MTIVPADPETSASVERRGTIAQERVPLADAAQGVRLAFTGDVHIEARHLGRELPNGQHSALVHQETALLALADQCAERGVDAVLIGGDLTHSNRPSPRALEILGRFFARLEQADITAVVIPGNHDPDVPGVAQHFRGTIYVRTAPDLVRIRTRSDALVDIACLPWLPDRFLRAHRAGAGSREEIARELTRAATDIIAGLVGEHLLKGGEAPLVLLTHATIAGTETSTGFGMGFLPSSYYVIPIEALASFELVAASHIHRHQAPAANVVVPGSLVPLDFSETEPKGFVYAEVARGEARWEFVRTPAPRIWTLEYTGDELRQAVLVKPAAAAELVRVRVRCDEGTARQFPPHRIAEPLYAAGAELVQVELEVERARRPRSEDVTRDLEPLHAIERYLLGRAEELTEARRIALGEKALQLVELVRERQQSAGGDVQLTRLEARDFIGIREALVDLDGDEVVALTGPVGVGKSTLGADLVRFALFGAGRYGARATERFIRTGADEAVAAVELESVDHEHAFRIVRKVRRSGRGSVSSLDVLAGGDTAWRPLSNGKVADGQQVIDRILGGLTDDTLTASSIVIQRGADVFARARPEERKRLLAEAAGLEIYDELAKLARDRAAAADRALEILDARAEPLRAPAQEIAATEKVIERLRADVAHDEERLRAYETALAAAREELVAAKAREAELLAAQRTAAALERDIAQIQADVAELDRNARAAHELLAHKAEVLGAVNDLAAVRRAIEGLEAMQRSEYERTELERAHADAAGEMRRLVEVEVTARKNLREKRLLQIEQQYLSAGRQVTTLANARCPVIEKIQAREILPCAFLEQADHAVRALPELEAELAQLRAPDEAETSAIAELESIRIPSVDPAEDVTGELRAARARAAELEKMAAVGGKIEMAEQILRAHEERRGVILARNEEKRAELEAMRQRCQELAAGTIVVDAERRVSEAEAYVTVSRRRLDDNRALVARGEGRLDEVRASVAVLGELEQKIEATARDAADWKGLVEAWRACRIMVLENSVIPAVEDTANEILRRFPYGLQMAFATQREKKETEGLAEALDIEVLGGRAPVYEGLSGGQRTAVDFAFHVAIALVVARRSSTRLRFMFADEPEGLDEAGRAAFAAIARWIHEVYGLTVLVASHAQDLVDALGARKLVIEPGPDGSRLTQVA